MSSSLAIEQKVSFAHLWTILGWFVALAAIHTSAPRTAHAADAARSESRQRTAFFYGPNVPPELLNHYDRVVVEPENAGNLVPPRPAAQGGATGVGKPELSRAEIFAYASIGEVHPTRSYRRDVPHAWVLGRNDEYGADIMDTTRPEWRAFVLDRILEPLYRKGYRGFFFDTLESYKRFAPQPSWGQHAAGLAAIVRGFAQRHPDAKILLNRGFEFLPQVAPVVAGVVAESLFSTWRMEGKTQVAAVVTPQQRDALLVQLREAANRYRLPVTVIDYLPVSAGVEARKAIAKKILALGFSPYVTGFNLDEIGVGEIENVPRRVLLLYKGSDDEAFLGVQDANVLVAPVMEWMGYRIDYHDVRRALPSHNLAGQYAGIIVFLPDGTANEAALERFLNKQLDLGMRIAFMEGFGFTPNERFLRRLGLAAASVEAKAPMTLVPFTTQQPLSPYVGFEAKPRPRLRELTPVNLGPNAESTKTKSYLHVEDAGHRKWDGVVLGPWGGAAFFPYVLDEGLEGERRWVLDPFRFLHDALGLPSIPVPDVTTESGRRELTVHIDGDAFPSLAERRGYPYAGQVILDDVLKVYQLPHTVSVVEGEVGPSGRYPEKSPALERIAREIFRLPNVEVASHTYSHPFFWADAEAGKTAPHGVEPVHLPIPGYKFLLERDIVGSVDYINKRLAPPDKRVRVLLWPGDCSPSGRAVGMSDGIGVYNVNGGGATRNRETPSLTRGSAMGVPNDNGAFQVFTPVENENVYTNDFLGPYYGYRRAIETFELNDNPRRLTHIPVYFHFYSAVKTAALAALKEVYAWVLRQETIPLYLSEYAAKVLAFQKVTLARRIEDGAWEIAQNGPLRTVRVDDAWGWPDLDKSTGVAGLRDVPQGRYVHLLSGVKVVLASRTSPSEGVYLEHANGQIANWTREAKGARFRIRGNVPLVITVGGVRRGASCTLRYGTFGARDATNTARGILGSVKDTRASTVSMQFTLKETDTGEGSLECQ
ncbi:endo alpha-1,4 polygalactosaminidase [Pendulispora albinea]|uniref:Endo alpha-1,4 polygalactosaminidase n=1 Tax=Pendulispora albinea TaxID=2741071 RepID=A0ABZ2LWD9_9BACT